MVVTVLLHVIALLVAPFLMIGLVNRTKSLWSGRKGPPLLQSAYDVIRLMRKTSVYSSTTTPLFRIAPWIFLLSAAASAVVTPILGAQALVSFPFDFVWLAYIWGLGRVAVMLAAMDTGSAFEGMGAAREATYATLLEPAVFLTLGALCLTSGGNSLHDALTGNFGIDEASQLVWVCGIFTLGIAIQVESARVPVDDPTTHLELTMIHEVMVLDHSGPDLGAIQYGAGLKLYVGAAMLATLLNPIADTESPWVAVINLTLCGGLAVLVGTVESLIARFKLRTVPKYIAFAIVSATIALLATAWQHGGAQ